MRRFALGYPERDRFGGLIEDVQSPAWTAAAGLGAGSTVALRPAKLRVAHEPARLDRQAHAFCFQISESFQ